VKGKKKEETKPVVKNVSGEKDYFFGEERKGSSEGKKKKRRGKRAAIASLLTKGRELRYCLVEGRGGGKKRGGRHVFYTREKKGTCLVCGGEPRGHKR